MIETMNRARRRCLVLLMLSNAIACSSALPERGPLTATSDTVTATGEYQSVALDGIERMTIENGKLVLHGSSGTQALDLPANANPEQRNRGWALVTEGETDKARTLTFTQETSVDDFTISVPAGEGQVVYGSLGGRDGSDVLLFAYGSAPRAYWGYVTIRERDK
jgi:hypothetical protein